MSKKNRLENKSLRRRERAAVAVLDRTPVSPIAQKTSARVLSNPKGKLSGPTRRRLFKSRGFALDRPLCLTVTHLPEVKVTLKLQALPLAKLYRRLKQACRRSATCGYILRDLHAGSKFAPGLKAEQTHQIFLAKQINAEIQTRNH